MKNNPGSILKEAREAKNLTIAQVVKATRIRAIYVHAMEADDYSMLPSPVQLRGFLRLYAEFLELNTKEIISLLPTQFQPESKEIPEHSHNEIIEAETSEDETIIESQADTQEPQIKRDQISDRTVKIENIPDQDESFGEFNKADLPEHSKAFEIFSQIGSQLKDRRELLGISIKEFQSQNGIEDKKSGKRNKFITTIKRVMSIDLIFGSLAIISLLIFMVWGTGKIIDIYRQPDIQATSA